MHKNISKHQTDIGSFFLTDKVVSTVLLAVDQVGNWLFGAQQWLVQAAG